VLLYREMARDFIIGVLLSKHIVSVKNDQVRLLSVILHTLMLSSVTLFIEILTITWYLPSHLLNSGYYCSI
jgi:hypothetical protein